MFPFGEKCQNNGLVSAENPYLYGGKELQTFFGIDWYDSGARFQTTHGTFSSLDPKAESYYPISPYAYCAGDPVNRIDLNGREWIEKGKVISVNLNISAEGINNDQMDIYKHAISEMFNEMISSASNGFFEGNVYFFDNNPSIVQSLTLSSFCDPSIGGQTSYMSSFVNPYDENGILLPAEVVALLLS